MPVTLTPVADDVLTLTSESVCAPYGIGPYGCGLYGCGCGGDGNTILTLTPVAND